MTDRKSLLTTDLSEIVTWSRTDLYAAWEVLYRSPAPKRIGRDLLVRAVAYRIQEQRDGGLRPALVRQLARTAEDYASGKSPQTAPVSVKPGTRLLREWQGVTHEVIVHEDGVSYRGKSWRSLSAVAREITGTRWSGPLFFGLKTRRSQNV